MNGHEQMKALIAVYDGLNDEERARVEHHAQSCPACRASLAAYRRMDVSLEKLADPKADRALRSDFYARLEAERPQQNGIWSSLPGLVGQMSARLAQAGALAVIALIVFSMWLALRSQPEQPAAVTTLPAVTPQPTVKPTSLPTPTAQPPTASPSPTPPGWTIELQETLSGPLNVVRQVTVDQQQAFVAAYGSSLQGIVWSRSDEKESYQPVLQAGLDYSTVGNTLAYSPQGYLALGGANGSEGLVSIWNVNSGEQIFSLPTAVPVVQSLAFSNGGDILALGTDSDSADSGSVYLWFLQYSDRLYELAFEGGDVTEVAFAPDDSLIAAASTSGVTLWQVVGNEFIRTLTAENESPTFSSLAFSADGQMLVAGTQEGLVFVWQVADGQLLYRFKTNTKPLQSLAFSADSQQIAAVAGDGQVTLWQIDAAGPVLQFSGQTAERLGLQTDVVFVGDKVLIAVGLADGQVQLWQISPE